METVANISSKDQKKRKLKIAGLIALAVAIFIIGGALAANRFSKKGTTAAKPKATATAQLVVSKLDGKPYPADKANRHPLAVVIENYPDARPQSGLTEAALVYEAITEGGITRFMAIYGPQDAKEVGPIRSARLFFMDWLKEYDAFFAHAGGNEDALANIDVYSIKDIPHANSYYYRDNKGKNIASEHTLYSSTEKLYNYAQSKKFDINAGSFEALKFKTDGPATATGGKGIEINFSGSPSYNVKWTYDPTGNQYMRFLNGVEHKDRNNNKQLAAKNVVVQEVSRTLQPHGSYGDQNWVFKTIGEGKVTVLRDGQVIEGTWKKTARDSRTKFYDKSGLEIEFNPGQTWFEIAAPDTTKTTII